MRHAARLHVGEPESDKQDVLPIVAARNAVIVATEDAEATQKASTFDRWFATYYPRLTGFGSSLGFARSVAEDAAQEVAVKVFQNWDRVSKPDAYAMVVLRRALVRAARAEAMRESLELQAFDNESLTAPAAADTYGEAEEVAAVVSLLPHQQRAVLALHVDGYKPSEIAELLQISPQAVRSNLNRARNAMKAVLASDGPIVSHQGGRREGRRHIH